MSIEWPIEGDRVRLEREDDGGVSIVRLRDGERVGHIRIEEQKGSLTIRALCVDEAQRSYGCGSEAGYLVVRAAEAAGFERIRAWAPPNLGLAVYFWFRMGFRPLHGEGPDGGIWLDRRLG
jgi:GNAT superfamily N-acetyltransferase